MPVWTVQTDSGTVEILLERFYIDRNAGVKALTRMKEIEVLVVCLSHLESVQYPLR